MKRVVSVSIGSSKRDHRVEVDLLGERFQIERIGKMTTGVMLRLHLYQCRDVILTDFLSIAAARMKHAP